MLKADLSSVPRLDSHQHFWRYNPVQHSWMTDAMQILRRDYLPQELQPLLVAAGFNGTIAVQARQMLEETKWLLHLADRHDYIKGVVGWVDLESPQVRQHLERYGAHPKLVGLRHVLHDEADDQFMLRPAFGNGLAQLRDFNLTYDLLLFPRHLAVAKKLVARFPYQPFVVDHIAKPSIGDKILSPWDKDIQKLARYGNVFCKLSGMVTEAIWSAWKPTDFYPYLDVVMQAFGPERVMIGSDWPVCTVSGNYAAVLRIVMEYVQQFSPDQQNKILGETCANFYRLKKPV